MIGCRDSISSTPYKNENAQKQNKSSLKYCYIV